MVWKLRCVDAPNLREWGWGHFHLSTRLKCKYAGHPVSLQITLEARAEAVSFLLWSEQHTKLRLSHMYWMYVSCLPNSPSVGNDSSVIQCGLSIALSVHRCKNVTQIWTDLLLPTMIGISYKLSQPFYWRSHTMDIYCLPITMLNASDALFCLIII